MLQVSSANPTGRAATAEEASKPELDVPILC